MGKRGPKTQITNVACPNKDCELYGITGQGNVVGNGTYISRGKKREDTFAVTAAKHFATIPTLSIMIFAKMRKLSI